MEIRMEILGNSQLHGQVFVRVRGGWRHRSLNYNFIGRLLDTVSLILIGQSHSSTIGQSLNGHKYRICCKVYLACITVFMSIHSAQPSGRGCYAKFEQNRRLVLFHTDLNWNQHYTSTKTITSHNSPKEDAFFFLSLQKQIQNLKTHGTF
jgi:hypothetical protein